MHLEGCTLIRQLANSSFLTMCLSHDLEVFPNINYKKDTTQMCITM